jgi:hypothetical protein
MFAIYLVWFGFLLFVERPLLEYYYGLNQIGVDNSSYYVVQAKLESARSLTFWLFILYSIMLLSYSVGNYKSANNKAYLYGAIILSTILMLLVVTYFGYFNPVL